MDGPLSTQEAARIQAEMAATQLFKTHPCKECVHTERSYNHLQNAGVDLALLVKSGWQHLSERASMFQPCAECQKPIDRTWIADIDAEAFRAFMEGPGRTAFLIDSLRELPKKT